LRVNILHKDEQITRGYKERARETRNPFDSWLRACKVTRPGGGKSALTKTRALKRAETAAGGDDTLVKEAHLFTKKPEGKRILPAKKGQGSSNINGV